MSPPDAAIAFLVAQQDRDGAWRDFALTPDESDAWTTAYVGLALAAAAQAQLVVPPHAIAAACGFLHAARRPGAGWGYNLRCPADADSTALACLLLAAAGQRLLPGDYAALARFQCNDGGFATYRFAGADHRWCRPHAEVTATALRALRALLPPGHERMRRGGAWLDRAGSVPPPYWWTTRAYLDLELMRLGRPVAFAGDPDSGGSFERALRLEAAALSGSPTEALHAALVERQLPDGSWPVVPMLRVPDPHRARAKETAFGDQRASFTTATALSALAALRRSRPGWRAAADR